MKSYQSFWLRFSFLFQCSPYLTLLWMSTTNILPTMVQSHPFLFVDNRMSKCIAVKSHASMTLHFHYYAPNIKVLPMDDSIRKASSSSHDPHHRYDPRHHHHDSSFHSGLSNVKQNMERHARLVENMDKHFHHNPNRSHHHHSPSSDTNLHSDHTEGKNSPHTQQWQRHVQQTRKQYNIQEEEWISNLSFTTRFEPMESHQHHGHSHEHPPPPTHPHVYTPKNNMMRYPALDKTGSVRYDVHESGTVHFCILCYSCSKEHPLMVALDVEEQDTETVNDIHNKHESNKLLSFAVQDAREKLRDVMQQKKEELGQNTAHLEKEHVVNQRYGKSHLQYLKQEVDRLMTNLRMEMNRSEHMKKVEQQMYRDGLRFNQSSKIYPMLKILILLVSTVIQARALVASFKKWNLI